MNAGKYNSVVPNNVRRLMNERGLNRDFVASKAGYSYQQLCDMLHGRKIIKPCDIFAIAGVVGVEPGELFVANEEMRGELAK